MTGKNLPGRFLPTKRSLFRKALVSKVSYHLLSGNRGKLEGNRSSAIKEEYALFSSFPLFNSTRTFLVVLRSELRALCLQSKNSTTCDMSPVHFSLLILETEAGGGGGASQTICPGWPQTKIHRISVILLISAS
jgi:hypothetical protein